MLSEKSQSQKMTNYIHLFIKYSWKDEILEMENKLMVAGPKKAEGGV